LIVEIEKLTKTYESKLRVAGIVATIGAASMVRTKA